MLSLKHPYISIDMHSGLSYGGGQQYSSDAMVRRCGCGIVAAADLLLYLNRWHLTVPAAFFDGVPEEGPVPSSLYDECILRLSRRFFPLIPYAGINGLMLMAGVERFFREQQMPFTARWCFASSRLWNRIEAMLRSDVPVILAAGPNFPIIWGKKRVRFYRKTADGSYRPTAGAKAHFFTVTGMDAEWLRISSWGRLYYLNRREFSDYARRDSLALTCNVLLVERKTS